MKKTKLNYWIDVIIGISFVLSAISGLIFLLPIDLGSEILGISYTLWSPLHTWSSLAMMAGVLAHLVLHWKWIVGMTKKVLSPAENSQESTPGVSGTRTTRRGMTRRQFLSFGLAALTGAIALGCSMLTENRSTNTEQEDSATSSPQDGSEQPIPIQRQATDPQPPDEPEKSLEQEDVDPPQEEEAEQPVQQEGVACPRGLVNDPYPGQCRHYTDKDDDGICDYSIPGSGNN